MTLAAVREAMQHRLEEGGLDAEAEREMQLALEMLALMWEEIVGQLLGAPREALVGRPLGSFVLEGDRAGFISRFVGLAMHPVSQPLSWSCRVQPAGGAPREVIVSVRAIPLRRSGVAGLCWLLRPA